MANRNEAIKAFREARIAGEKKLSRGEISWEDYRSIMLDFEQDLRGQGVQL